MSTSLITSSTRNFTSTNNYSSTNNIYNEVYSTNDITGTNDIMLIIKNNPFFIKGEKSDIERIIAACASGISILGGVTLLCVAGTLSAVTSLVSSIFISTGLSGVTNTLQKDFYWGSWAKDIAEAAGLTLITFGAGYGAGSSVRGIALLNKNLSHKTLQTIGTAAGAIAGCGTRAGTYTIIKYVNGKKVEALEIVIEGLVGAIEGGRAGFLGAKIKPIKPIKPSFDYEKKMLESIDLGEYSTNYTISIIDGKEVVETIDTKNLILGCVKLEDLSNKQQQIALVLGNKDFGLLHMLYRHPDIFERLGFSKLDLFLNSENPKEFLKLLTKSATKITGILERARCYRAVSSSCKDTILYFFEIYDDKFLQFTRSKDLFRNLNQNCYSFIQANIIDGNKLRNKYKDIVELTTSRL